MSQMQERIALKPSLLSPAILAHDSSALAFQWLRGSGIQDLSNDPLRRGGVNAWYDLRKGNYPFIYSEITGYAVSAFLFWHSLTGDDGLLENAVMAADWLRQNRDPESGLMRTRLNAADFQNSYFESWVFAFDQWVIVYGLSNLAGITKRSDLLEDALGMADFLLRHTVHPNGFFYPVYDLKNKRPEAAWDKWSRQPGGYHAKSLTALLKLAELSGEERFFLAARKIVSQALDTQDSTGRFITQSHEKSTHLHPHLYTLEGLLSYAVASGDPQVFLAVEKGMEWLLSNQNSNGSLFAFYQDGAFRPFVRVDVLAQALRAAVILRQHGRLQSYEEAVSRLKENLLSYQVLEGPQRGGFFYGQEENGQVHFHVNAWASMFAGQALAVDAFYQNSDPYDMSFFV